MNDDIKYEIEILAYLENEMNAEDRSEFEHKLTQDVDLLLAFNEYKLLLHGVDSWGDQLTKQQIMTYDQKLNQEGYFQKSNRIATIFSNVNTLKWIGVAASLLILILVYVFINPNQKPSNEIVISEYYIVNEKLLNNFVNFYQPTGIVATDSLQKDSFYLGLTAYQKKDYSQAISLLQPQLRHQHQDEVAKFYLALSYVELKKFQNAIDLLVPLTNARKFEIREESKWYLALTNLQAGGNLEGTKALLRDLAQSSYEGMAIKAKTLLSKLK